MTWKKRAYLGLEAVEPLADITVGDLVRAFQLASQESPTQRRVGGNGDIKLFGGGSHAIGENFGTPEREFDFDKRQRVDGIRLSDGFAADLAETDASNFAFANDFLQRFNGLLQWDARVNSGRPKCIDFLHRPENLGAVLQTLPYTGAVTFRVEGGEVTAAFDKNSDFGSIGWVGREVSVQKLQAFGGVGHSIELGSRPEGGSLGNGSLHRAIGLLI